MEKEFNPRSQLTGRGCLGCSLVFVILPLFIVTAAILFLAGMFYSMIPDTASVFEDMINLNEVENRESAEGQLVSYTGRVKINQKIHDPFFLSPANYLFLEKEVEEFRVETREKQVYNEDRKIYETRHETIREWTVVEEYLFKPERINLDGLSIDTGHLKLQRTIPIEFPIENYLEPESAGGRNVFVKKKYLYLTADDKPGIAPSEGDRRISFRYIPLDEDVTVLGAYREGLILPHPLRIEIPDALKRMVGNPIIGSFVDMFSPEKTENINIYHLSGGNAEEAVEAYQQFFSSTELLVLFIVALFASFGLFPLISLLSRGMEYRSVFLRSFRFSFIVNGVLALILAILLISASSLLFEAVEDTLILGAAYAGLIIAFFLLIFRKRRRGTSSQEGAGSTGPDPF